MLRPCTSFSHHKLTSLAQVSGCFIGTWAAPGIFHYNKTEAPGRKQFVERKVSVEGTKLKKLTVSCQTGCRKTSMVTFSWIKAQAGWAQGCSCRAVSWYLLPRGCRTMHMSSADVCMDQGPANCQMQIEVVCSDAAQTWWQCSSLSSPASTGLLPSYLRRIRCSGAITFLFHRFAKQTHFLTMCSRPPIWKIFLKNPVRNMVWLR